MSNKKDSLMTMQNEKKVTQALVVLDTFENEFRPISDDLPIALIPLANKPLLDYTLEFLKLAGVDETFLFCCTHVEVVKTYVKKCQEEGKSWALTMKINVIVSETCCSFGDCLRDVDAKGLIRGDFILLEPGVISNMKLLPIIEQHHKHVKHDKGVAMTLIYQQSTVRQVAQYPLEMSIVAMNNSKKILAHKKVGLEKDSRVDFPLDIFLENSCVKIRHNLRDTHVAICSPSVLPLFADNFDFQTKDDFVRGLLMNEEILESTLYSHILQGDQHGSAVSNWRMYQILSYETAKFWMCSLTSNISTNHHARNNTIVGNGTKIPDTCVLQNAVVGNNVRIGANCELTNCFVFSDCEIESGVNISTSIIGGGSTIKENSQIEDGTIIGKGVVIEKGCKLSNSRVKSNESDEDLIRLSDKAYIITNNDDSDNDSDQCDLYEMARRLSTQIGTLDIEKESGLYEVENLSESDDDDELSYTESPVPGDTELFFAEVVDSLTRGFEDKLICDNLILEVNSSRYAYNVSLREVNVNVVRAILHMSIRNNGGKPIVSYLNGLLSYFHPLLSNYIRNKDAIEDCLQAIEDIATTDENVTDKWVILAVKWFYDKEHITEEAVLEWHSGLNTRSSKLHNYIKPFVEWLQEAEETSEDDSSD